MTKDITLLATSFVEDIRKDNLQELTNGQQQKNTDVITDNVPGLSFIGQLKKLYTGVQDFFLIKKVNKFLFELSSMPLESRIHLIDMINEDPIHGQKFGEFLIAALDRHDFETKSVMLARVCKYYESGKINRQALVRFKGIIQQMDIDDLVQLKYMYGEVIGYPRKRDHVALYQFQTFGLIQIRSGSELRVFGNSDLERIDSNEIEVELTRFGRLFIKIINDYLEIDLQEASVTEKPV